MESLLIQRYPNETTADLAEDLNVTVTALQQKNPCYGVKKRPQNSGNNI